MSSDRRADRLVGVVHAGVGWTTTEWKGFRAVFHGFESLPPDRSAQANSQIVQVHGYEWLVMLYPGGHTLSDETVTHVSAYVRCVDANERGANIKASLTIGVPAAGVRKSTGCNSFEAPVNGRESAWGFHNFVARADVLDPSKHFLSNGNLILEVEVQVEMEMPPAWAPSNTVCTDMLKLLDLANEETADVIFQVGKKKKKIYAHRSILSVRAPALAALVELYDADTPFPIDGIKPKVFHQLLRFVYGGEVPDEIELPDEARSLIDVADRFGLTGLKLAAESELATSGIEIDNAAELILFADSKNCAELKEAAVDFFVSNSEAVMKSEGFAKVKESADVTTELMSALAAHASGNKRRLTTNGDEDNNYSNVLVRVLRRKLDEKGLDVDGSKEILIRRLDEAEGEGTN